MPKARLLLDSISTLGLGLKEAKKGWLGESLQLSHNTEGDYITAIVRTH